MTIPVVQGTPVAADHPYDQSSYLLTGEEGNFPTPSGPHNHAKQTNFQDLPWAMLFVAHLITMIVIISMNLAGGGNGGQADTSYNGVIWMVGLTAVVAIALSSTSLGLMMSYPGALVKVSLFVTVGMSLVMAITGLVMGQIWFGICGLLMFAIGVCYARAVWSRYVPGIVSSLQRNANSPLSCIPSIIESHLRLLISLLH
jgi:hypothetical protein